MASAVYPLWKQNQMTNSDLCDLDDAGTTIKCAIVNITSDYTYSASHEFFSSVTRYSGTTDQTLSSKAVSTTGVFSASNISYTGVSPDGTKKVGAFVIYKDTGSAATSPLIAYIEFSDFLPNTGNIGVTWNASGIFQL